MGITVPVGLGTLDSETARVLSGGLNKHTHTQVGDVPEPSEARNPSVTFDGRCEFPGGIVFVLIYAKLSDLRVPKKVWKREVWLLPVEPRWVRSSSRGLHGQDC